MLDTHIAPTRSQVAAAAATALRQAPLLPSEGSGALRLFTGTFDPPPPMSPYRPFAARRAAAEGEGLAFAASAGSSGGGAAAGLNLKRKKRQRLRTTQSLFVSARPLAPYVDRLASSVGSEEPEEGEALPAVRVTCGETPKLPVAPFRHLR